MKFYYFSVVLLLTLFIPHENFLLKWMPVSDSIYSAMRFLHEVIIYALLAVVIFIRLRNKSGVVTSSIHWPLIVFLLYTFAVIFFNKTPLNDSLINLRSFIRYIMVFYIVINLVIDETRIKAILKALVFIGTLSSLLAVYQHFAGISSVWLPRATNLEVEGHSTKFTIIADGYHGGREKGAGIGLFGDTVPFALFQVFACTILFSALILSMAGPAKFNMTLMCLFIINMSGLFFTYSRGTSLALLIAFPLVILLSKKWYALKTCLAAIVLLVLTTMLVSFLDNGKTEKISRQNELKEKSVSPLENVKMVFEESYYTNDTYSRPWVLFVLGKSILKSNFFGYGPSQDFAKQKIFRASDNPISMIKILDYDAFEDVYWVAMLAYYGVIGVLIFVYILIILYRKSIYLFRNSVNFYGRVLGISFAVLVLQTFFLTFIVRTFEFRVFGFNFWLLAGLVCSYLVYLNKNFDKGIQHTE